MLVKENQIIRVTELAKLLGVTDRHLRNLANEGVVKKNGKWKVFIFRKCSRLYRVSGTKK